MTTGIRGRGVTHPAQSTVRAGTAGTALRRGSSRTCRGRERANRRPADAPASRKAGSGTPRRDSRTEPPPAFRPAYPGSAMKSTARCSTLRSRDDSETAYFHFPCRILYRYGMKNASQPPAGGATQSVCPDIRLFFRKHSSSAGCCRLLVAASPFSGHAAPPEVSVTLQIGRAHV